MFVTALLVGGFVYCLYKLWRDAWWAPQALIGMAAPSLVAFAAFWGGNLSVLVPLLALVALSLAIALPKEISYHRI